jgi:hypothetical protein
MSAMEVARKVLFILVEQNDGIIGGNIMIYAARK